MSEIRSLAPRDLADLVALSRQAHWNQTEHDWRRLLHLWPHGCLGMEAGGRVVASTTAACYGDDLAWIGMVLTDAAHRGQGYAGALMQSALESLRARRVAWIKLDATDMGRPIYARLGFQDECAVERWKRPASAAPVAAPPEPFSPGFDPDLDRAAFGTSRLPLLQSLAAHESASIPGEGFAMARPGALASYFGPCVARSEQAARRLLEWRLSRCPNQDVFWDLLPSNAPAASLAREYGFAPVRHLTRMALPGCSGAPPAPRCDNAVYAIAGFEFG